jgi:hypothetical protein
LRKGQQRLPPRGARTPPRRRPVLGARGRVFNAGLRAAEQLARNYSAALDHGTYSTAEALSYFPEMRGYNGVGPGDYLELVHAAKTSVDIPVIGSLNGISPGGWVEYARLIQEAGADALELNVYFIPASPFISGKSVEGRYVEILRDVKRSVSIPVAMKLIPYFSSLGDMARRLVDEGWMEENKYVWVSQMIGSMSRTNVADPSAFERVNYMKMLTSYRAARR